MTKLDFSLLINKNVLNPKIAELSRQLEEKELEYFNLNVEDIFEAIVGRKPKNIEEAAANEEVQEAIDSSKVFLANWSKKFAETVFSGTTQIPLVFS